MDLNNTTLDKYLELSKASYTINGQPTEFFSLYDTLRAALLPKHQETTAGAILTDLKEKLVEMQAKVEEAIELENDPKLIRASLFQIEKLMWLNDHGPDHIATVIKRASQLLNCGIKLSFRETYCLLCAIQLHDLGNFYGRKGHEQAYTDVVAELSNKIGSDHVERKYIGQIASVHGGTISNTGNKDTISQLKSVAPVLDEPVRIKLLAAILRFADELADDRSRASIDLLLKSKLPKSSEIYHAYSFCLSSVIIDHGKHNVELHFDIPRDFLEKKFGKDDKEVYLIDEIHSRSLKMYLEKRYCSRFWQSEINLENIVVIINFYDNNQMGEIHPETSFTLREHGYPETNKNIFQICPDLITKDGLKLNGEYYKTQLCKV